MEQEWNSCLHPEPAEPHCCLLPSPREEQGAAGEARSLELLGFVPPGSSAGVPREPEPLRMVWQSCQLIFFTLFLRRRKDECHQGGDPGGDSGQVTQTGHSHPGCPLSSFPTPGEEFCHRVSPFGGCALAV